MLIEVALEQERIAAVEVKLRRVQVAARLCGLSVREIARAMRLLYSLCAHAHGAAAAAALASARGDIRATALDDEVAAEAAREHLLAVSTGVVKSFLPDAVRALRRPGELRRFLDGPLIGLPTEEWLRLSSTSGLTDWAEGSEAALAREFRRRWMLAEPQPSAIRHLPALDAAASLECWPEIPAGFAATPEWGGAPAEVGAISRESARLVLGDLHDRPLLQRWLARVIELARYACADPTALLGRVSAASPGPNRGRAAVETARGTLMHDVRIADDRIVRYVVVAPTEWNFHPDGLMRRWLVGLLFSSSAAALELAQRAAATLDPCVECRCVIHGT